MPKVTVFGANGALLRQTDDRTLAEAKAEAGERVMVMLTQALAAMDDGPAREAQQWIAIGLLHANAGAAFASWPAGQQTIWNNQVKPHVDAVAALRARIIAARQAIQAATTNAQADAVVL